MRLRTQCKHTATTKTTTTAAAKALNNHKKYVVKRTLWSLYYYNMWYKTEQETYIEREREYVRPHSERAPSCWSHQCGGMEAYCWIFVVLVVIARQQGGQASFYAVQYLDIILYFIDICNFAIQNHSTQHTGPHCVLSAQIFSDNTKKHYLNVSAFITVSLVRARVFKPLLWQSARQTFY